MIGDGTNNYAHINGNPVDPNLDWSTAIGFKPDTGGLGATGTVRSFVFETGGTTYPISFGLRAGAGASSTVFQLYTHTTSTSTSQDAIVPAAQMDQWHQLVLTYDAALGTMTGYLDGAATYNLALGPGTTLQSYTGFNLGTYRTADGRWFKGLGNHDNDGGFAWQKVQDFWSMPSRYYSFDQGGWHFVVLDGNEKKPVKPAPGYPRFGEAVIVKALDGRLSLRGGTPEDQAAARAWAAQFMSRPLSEPPRLKYTVLPRPERPAAQQRPLPPTPPVRQPPTPEKQLHQCLINNHPALQTAHAEPDAPAPAA